MTGSMAGPNTASSSSGSSNTDGVSSTSGGGSSSSGMGNGSGGSSSKPSSPKAEAAVAGTAPPLIPAFGSAPSAASVTTGPKASGTVGNRTKTWKPAYPFPQCLDNTLTYDVSFVGQRQFIQVGE
jgi:hypothetical protein